MSFKRFKNTATLWRLMTGQRLRYGAAIGALFVATLLVFMPPLIVRTTIDSIIGDKPFEAPAWVLSIIESLGGRSTLSQHLWLAGLLIVIITGAGGVAMYLRGRWAAAASETIARDLRDRLYNRLLHLTCRYHDDAETGDLVQRCTSDVDTIRTFLSQQVVELIRAIANLAVVVPIMLMLDWRMTIATTALVPIIFAFGILFFLAVKKNFKLADEAEGALTSTIQENLTGIRVVRAFARQDYEQGKFDERNAEHQQRDWTMYRIFAWYWSLSDFLIFIQMGLTLFVGAWLVSRGVEGGGIGVGTLVAFWWYVGMVIWPVRQMGRTLSELGKALVALERVGEILDAPVEADPVDPITDLPERVEGRIVFDDVHFAHKAELPVLHGVSISIEPGETLAIVGPSGSGKSTMMNLLLRFYDHDAGSITIDGMPIDRLPRKYVRGQVGVVMQEPFLYSKTLRDNIRLGRREARDEEVVDAANAACVHNAIERFDEGYNTIIGERGVTLSGGQRQRVSLARALLQRPPILILDDAFSAVDTHTEKMILNALKQRHGEQTTIVIAHRVSTLMHADRIIALEGGRITQCGTHEQLIAEQGVYRRLWEIQSSLEDDLLAG